MSNVVRPTLEECYEFNARLRDKQFDEVSQELINRMTSNRPKVQKDSGLNYLSQLVPGMLNFEWYVETGAMLWGKELFTVEPQSVKKIWSAIQQSSELLIMGAGSLGKCMGRGTKVLMYDGSVRKVEDIEVGDEVMGYNNQKRTVLSLHSGVSDLYQVNQCRAEPYVVNENHILTLRCVANQKNNRGGKFSSRRRKGLVIDMPIKEYMSSSSNFKEYYKGFSQGVGDVWEKKPCEFDPYIFGLWLGDGSSKGISLGFTSMDTPLIDIWCKYWERRGARIYVNSKKNSRASTYIVRDGISLQNRFKFAIKDGEKFIPDRYLTNSLSRRLDLLAGILDSDGYLQDGGYGFSFKNEDIARGTAFLARSVGLTCSLSLQESRCGNTGKRGFYWRGNIHGDCSIIPCRLKKVTAPPSRVPLGRALNIQPIGRGEYFGFTLDGDGRFLLGDFTVTHNSFSIAAWCLLDWLRDPLQTNFKVVSLTREHAKRNAFASIKMLHSASAIPLPGGGKATIIQADDNDKQGIHLEALRRGDDGAGKLQGIHCHPRATHHPQFKMTRVRIIVDEAEEVPQGVWADIDNFLTSKFDSEHTKVICAANPRRPNSRFGQRCRPKKGWATFDVERDETWKSELGWHVLRLDGIHCENVKLRRVVYPGLLTWEGFSRYLALGETHPDYWTMARGMFPPQGVSMVVIPTQFFERGFGTLTFKGSVTPCAACDLAFEGGDRVVLAIGRWGMATGWTNTEGEFFPFEKEGIALQVDGVFDMPKLGNTIPQAHNIIQVVKAAGVTPHWLIVDRTGNGTGVHDVLKLEFGQDVMGLHYGTEATDSTMFTDDSKPAKELYDGVVTELMFSVSRMLEFDLIKFGKGVPRDEVAQQLTDRLYRHVKTRVRVEPKADFKARNTKSPDHADALTMLAHIVRQRALGFRPSMTGKKIPPKKPKHVSGVDKLDFLDITKD